MLFKSKKIENRLVLGNEFTDSGSNFLNNNGNTSLMGLEHITNNSGELYAEKKKEMIHNKDLDNILYFYDRTDIWICRNCEVENRYNNEYCYVCDKKRG